MKRRMVWSANTLAYARLVEELTYERYTGYTTPAVFAYRQTQKAVRAYWVEYGTDRYRPTWERYAEFDKPVEPGHPDLIPQSAT